MDGVPIVEILREINLNQLLEIKFSTYFGYVGYHVTNQRSDAAWSFQTQ